MFEVIHILFIFLEFINFDSIVHLQQVVVVVVVVWVVIYISTYLI